MKHSNEQATEQGDAELRKLFKVAGPRVEPPADMQARVYKNTLAHWHDEIDKIETNVNATSTSETVSWNTWAIAAGIFMIGLVGLLFITQTQQTQTQASGQILFATGSYHIRGDDVGVGEVANGALVSTSDSGRLEIQLANTVFLRMDHSTSATIASNEEIWLHHGRIYIDAQGAPSVRVVTTDAAIVDVGTQFEISMNNDQLSVAVREGRVDISLLDNKTIAVSATRGLGELVLLDGAQIVNRQALSSTDPHWQWTHSARQPYQLRKPKADHFLSWASREAGLEIVYQSPAVEQVAKKEELTIDKPMKQLNVEIIREVLSTSTLTIARQKENQLVIDLIR